MHQGSSSAKVQSLLNRGNQTQAVTERLPKSICWTLTCQEATARNKSHVQICVMVVVEVLFVLGLGHLFRGKELYSALSIPCCFSLYGCID